MSPCSTRLRTAVLGLALLAWIAGLVASAQAHAAPSLTSGPLPSVPAAPPQAAVIPPPDAAPPHPTAPPPPPPVHTDAPGEVFTRANGIRLTFGEGRADLNPATEAAVHTLARSGIAHATTVFDVYAYAAGTPQDTSTPRRLSLERALAIRSVLINAGIASIRIYVHAIGATGPDDASPPDRVDVTLANLNAPAPVNAPSRPPSFPAAGATATGSSQPVPAP